MPARVCGRSGHLSAVFSVFLRNVRARGPVKARPDERERLRMVNRPALRPGRSGRRAGDRRRSDGLAEGRGDAGCAPVLRGLALVPTRRTSGGGGAVKSLRFVRPGPLYGPIFVRGGFGGGGGIEDLSCPGGWRARAAPSVPSHRCPFGVPHKVPPLFRVVPPNVPPRAPGFRQTTADACGHFQLTLIGKSGRKWRSVDVGERSCGAGCRDRTDDLPLTRRVLYQLS